MNEVLEPAVKAVERYAEDPVGNFLMAADLAPVLCPDCAAYHVRYTARRAARYSSGKGEVHALDRREMVELLAPMLAERVRAGRGAVDVMLAGSADTGLLAAVATAADVAGPGVMEAVRFAVIDRCPTPLVLCAAFGKRHRLQVGIQTFDFLAPQGPAPADVIVVHSVLRFVPRERQNELLGRLMSWLKPGGQLVLSTAIGTRSDAESVAALARFAETFREEVEAGRIPFKRPLEPFLAGLAPSRARAGDVTEVEAIRALVRDSGLRVDHWRELQGDPARWGGRNNLRVLAVLARPD
jgi:hypothetical protein